MSKVFLQQTPHNVGYSRLYFLHWPSKVLGFLGFSCKDIHAELFTSKGSFLLDFQASLFLLQGAWGAHFQGFCAARLRIMPLVIYTFRIFRRFLRWPSEGAWIFVQWPSTNMLNFQCFLHHVKQTCWISKLLVCSQGLDI